MMEKVKTWLSLLVIIICLPYLVTFVVQGDFLNDGQQQESAGKDSQEDTGKLVLILAKEMPVTFEKEALKAQAVIARTNLAYAKAHDQTEPESISWEDMRDQLGAKDFQRCYDLLKSCVEETSGEIITRKKKLIQLPYHYVSAGKTRNASELDEKSGMPYLKSVESANDLQCERFLKIEFLSKKQFQNKLKEAYPDLDFDQDTIEKMESVEKRDRASYVLTVQLPGKKVTGEEFRKIFSLHSACFSIKEVDGQVRIVTKGYGQGFGMSQFGADKMAEDGSSYEEILSYYYDGIAIDG